MDYDVIVIGAGNGGLIAATYLALQNKKVLLLEKRHISGGLSTSFVRGRFEFDTMSFPLVDYGSNKNYGNLRNLFRKLGIENSIEVVNTPMAFRLITTDPELADYTMPFGVENFIDKMEEYVPGSRNSMVTFFDLAREAKAAMEYLHQNNYQPNIKELKKKYGNFTRVASYSIKDVLYTIEMPIKAQKILNACWIYFGVSQSHLSFIHYALFLLSYLENGAVVPINHLFGIALSLEERFISLGGFVQHNVAVEEILVKDDKAVGVVTSNGRTFYANKIIANISPTNVYGKMIKSELNLNKEWALVNHSKIGAKGLNIYIGLNRSKEELGIKDYLYLIYHSLDSDEEYQKMASLENDSMIVSCLNKVIPDCSPKGTTVLCISSLYFGDCFDENVLVENYYALKNSLALKFINRFESTTGIKIRDFIEEIEVATPITYAHLADSYDGAVYGYSVSDSDGILERLKTLKTEPRIRNLYFCGGYAMYGSGYSGVYFSGELAAKLALEEDEI